MSHNQQPHSPSPGEGDAHSPQPKADDAVLGGTVSHPIDAGVLGGIEAVKRRLASTEIELRIAALSEAFQYGEAGLDLVMAALEDKSWTLQRAAYSLLKNRQEARVKQWLIKFEFEFDVVTVDANGQEINRVRRQTQYFTEDLGNGVTLEMVYIPGGRFMMGSPEEEGSNSEQPQHEVTVEPFFMGKYPITQAQWRAIASRADLKVERGFNPNPNRADVKAKHNLDPNLPRFKDSKDSDRRPVELVCWYNAAEFCQRLSKLTGREYCLPSEAEWEYACRAGTTTPFYFGDTITTNLANYKGSTCANEPDAINRQETTPVGSFPANTFGLYDMHGNVWEWCCDPGHENYLGAPTDGSVWEEDGDLFRPIVRGGSWLSYLLACRCASRESHTPILGYSTIGFRVVCGLGELSSSSWQKINTYRVKAEATPKF
jgi:formylglycine-generating enzyme required for sulfatase activity